MSDGRSRTVRFRCSSNRYPGGPACDSCGCASVELAGQRGQTQLGLTHLGLDPVGSDPGVKFLRCSRSAVSSRVIPIVALAQISSSSPASSRRPPRPAFHAIWAAHDGLGRARDAPRARRARGTHVWDGHAITLVRRRQRRRSPSRSSSRPTTGASRTCRSRCRAVRSQGGARLRYSAPDWDRTIARDRPIRLFALTTCT